jgi:hypothetical protein
VKVAETNVAGEFSELLKNSLYIVIIKEKSLVVSNLLKCCGYLEAYPPKNSVGLEIIGITKCKISYADGTFNGIA